jgi:aspartate racemase
VDRLRDNGAGRDRLHAMRTIGLIGGMSWESSAVYYRDLNRGVRERLGGLSSPKLVLSTVDFAEVTALEYQERWQQIGELLAEAARGVERGGADFLLMCTTTFHKVADQVEAAVQIPLLHLADVVADEVVATGVTKVGFIGTTVAMSDGFFTDRLAQHGLETVVPDASEHDWINSAIYDELVHGRVEDSTRRRVLGVMEQLWDAGAGGVLIGCTELELLVKQADAELPLFPCTSLHVDAALDRALAD